MKAHCRENDVKRASRRGTCRLVHAAVAPQSGQAWFYIGKAPSWYGQAIASDKTTDDETARAKVRAVTLSHLLRPLDVVDLIHLDIQGTESEVLQEAATQLDKKVRRVHIGTHASAIEDELRSLFGGLGWTSLNDYGCGTDSHTPWGRMTFQDGIQTWVNARLARDDRR